MSIKRNIFNSLMSLEEYAKKEWPDIYTFTIQSGDGSLFYFGATHSNNPNNKMFLDIKKQFDEFEPDAVFIEGFLQLRTEDRFKILEWAKNLNEKELIHEAGESGYTIKLAIEKMIFVDSPEPKFQEEITYLQEEGFSKDEMFAYYMLRYIQQRTRIPEPRPSIEEYAASELKFLQKLTRWNDFDFSLSYFYKVANKIWGDDFDVNGSERELLSKIDPIPWEDEKLKQTAVNAVSRASGEFRDQYIVQEIDKVLQNHKRLFIVYGLSHAVIQEPALRKILKNKNY